MGVVVNDVVILVYDLKSQKSSFAESNKAIMVCELSRIVVVDEMRIQ